MSATPLDAYSIAWGLLMVAAVLGMNLWHRLGMERTLLLAAVRTVAQLTAVGFVIGWVFERSAWYLIVGLLVVMALVAAQAAAGRVRPRRRGMMLIFMATLTVVTLLTLLYVTQVVVGVHQWEPQYLIPLGGIVLGNAMTAGSLAAERLLSEVTAKRVQIESMLAMGARPARAVLPQVRTAVRAAITPIVNSMMIVGIVKLPGIMTGQMLGGQGPLQASLYQMVVMFMIVFGDSMAAIVIVLVLRGRLFTHAAQLRPLE